jgi:6-pyruvoyltetrahydropterin/6-carboxytetrahydropterin synthase
MLQQFYPTPSHNYLYELNKDMNFASAHFVPSTAAGKCADVHGHTYFVNVTVAGDELDESGFLVNFQAIKKLIHGRYDHTVMNNHPEFSAEFNGENFMMPTTEVVARQIWETVETHLQGLPNRPTCLQVIVRETPTSYIVFKPKGAK